MSLKRTLRPIHIWALAVGLVISGEYFGWSYGWSVSGPLGFLVSTLIVSVLYITLVFSFTELTTSIPEAGGPFAYAGRAMGPAGGFFAGFATTVEFLFAPPAIAFALGSYLHVLYPILSIDYAAMLVLILFTILNLFSLKHSARFELIVTILAVAELLIFLGVVLPYFSWEKFSLDGWRGGAGGIFAAIPFAIWFFLAIEGVAMSSEEVVNPQRDIPIGYIAGIATLVTLALGVMFAAGGVGDWQKISQMDYPIPEAVAMALGHDSPWVKAFAGIGLFGLIASLNGIVFGSSRQIYAVARVGILPSALAQLNRFSVPHKAVLFTGAFSCLAILSGKTSQLITLSAMGAVSMYIMSMLSVLILRRKEPMLLRPFRVPFFPWFPLVALGLSIVCLGAMVFYNPGLFGMFLILGGVSFLFSFSWKTRSLPTKPHLPTISNAKPLVGEKPLSRS